MIDPKAEPTGHRPPYKPIDVSGRKPVQETPVEPDTLMVMIPGRGLIPWRKIFQGTPEI